MNFAARLPAPVPTPVGGIASAIGERDAVRIAIYLLVSVPAILLYFLWPPGLSDAAYMVASGLPVVTLVVGPRLFHVENSRPWLLLAAGQAAFFVGDLIFTADTLAGTASFPSVADIAYLIGYPLLALGVFSLIRERAGNDIVARLDALLVGVAGALVLWVLRIEPLLHDDSLSGAAWAITASYPIGDTLLLAGAAYLVFSNRGRSSPAGLVLVASLVSLLLADLLYAPQLSGYVAGVPDALWITSYVLFGLVPLLPSMATLTQPSSGAGRRVGTAATAVLALAAIPIYVVLDLLLNGGLEPLIVITAASLIVSILVVRIHLLSRSEVAQHVRYSRVLEHASEALAVIQTDGTISLCSAAVENVLGYRADRFLGRNVADLVDIIHPDDVSTRARRLLRALHDPGARAETDMRLRHADGTYRQLRITVTNRLADPSVGGVVVSCHDVSAERAADDHMRFQASILANLSEAVIATDLSGRITHWNAGATAIYGYPAEEMLGTSLARVYPNQSVEALAADIDAIGDGADFLGEWGGKRKDGSDVWVDIRTTVLRDINGKAFGCVGVSRDVTNERATRRRLVRLQTAIENTSEAILIVGREGRVEYANPGFESMTGFAASRQIGVEGWLMNGAPEIAGPWSGIGDVVGSGTPWSGDISGTRNDGMPFQASVVVSPIREPSDEPSGYVVVARNVTEERRYEESARQQARERALIAETIRAIDSHGTTDEIATAICSQVASLSEVQLAALFVFAGDGEAVPTGTFMTDGQEPPMMSLPSWRTEYLRDQCKRGPWIEAWRPNPDHPYDALFGSLHVKATAFAPVRDGKHVVGFLIINSSVDNAEQQLAESLPALVEFAEITSTVLGARLADRTINDAAVASLASVIALQAFRPVYQPIVDVEVGRIVGYEGLTRFDDGTDPETRFREAAALGMSEELEMAAFRAIVEGAESLQGDAWLNVNLSPAVISSARELADIIAASERRIVIEVTEHEAIDDYGAFRDAMHRLGPRVRLAVDDAGAGFASMRHIVELRPDYVKLDRAVVAGINRDEARRALAVGMRQFARTAGFWLIAEGVETPAELRTLREIDIHYIQGYLVGKPATAEELRGAEQSQKVAVSRR